MGKPIRGQDLQLQELFSQLHSDDCFGLLFKVALILGNGTLISKGHLLQELVLVAELLL